MNQSVSRSQRSNQRQLLLGNQIRLRTAGHEVDQSNSIGILNDQHQIRSNISRGNQNTAPESRPISNQEDWTDKINLQN